MSSVGTWETTMPAFEPGDHVKSGVRDEETGDSEWMWLLVDHCNEDQRLVFGKLGSQPVVFPNQLKLGQHLAVHYDNVREHRKKDHT